MGLMASCARRTAVVSPQIIRVVRPSGQVDEFTAPVTANRVLQNHPRHFICCSRDLYNVNFRALQPEEEIPLGELYFLLPFSALESAENLVALATRLFAAARKEASRAAQRRRNTDSTCDLPSKGHGSMYDKLVLGRNDPQVKMVSSKSRSWRPPLYNIHEIGFAG